MKPKRIAWIVSLRALAAVAVVLLHVSSTWLESIGGVELSDRIAPHHS